jgi:hypothetical protein
MGTVTSGRFRFLGRTNIRLKLKIVITGEIEATLAVEMTEQFIRAVYEVEKQMVAAPNALMKQFRQLNAFCDQASPRTGSVRNAPSSHRFEAVQRWPRRAARL